MASVFAERYAQACRRHPDLVAVHESPNGDIALVLRHTFVPLPEEHAAWRRAARAARRPAAGRPAAEGRATAGGRPALPRVAQHRAPAAAAARTPDVRVRRPLVHGDGTPVAAASAGGTPPARAANPRLDHRTR